MARNVWRYQNMRTAFVLQHALASTSSPPLETGEDRESPRHAHKSNISRVYMHIYLYISMMYSCAQWHHSFGGTVSHYVTHMNEIYHRYIYVESYMYIRITHAYTLWRYLSGEDRESPHHKHE